MMKTIKARSRYDEPVTEAVLLRAVARGLAHIRMTSRNRREGRYVGRWQGKAVRSTHFLFRRLGADAEVAWTVMSTRAKMPLPVRRPRYIAHDHKEPR
jgi:hypothetical protein